MGRLIKTASTSGASSTAAGLSTSDVNTLIQGKTALEYIKTLTFTGQITHITFDDADVFDWDTYSQIKFSGRNIRKRQGSHPAFQLRYGNAAYSMSYINHYANTYNNTSNQNIIYSFHQVGQYHNISFDITIHYNNPRLSANWNTYMGQTGGYNEQHNWGSGFYGSATGGLTGIKFYNFQTDTASGGDDKIEAFGIRRDTKRSS